MKRYVSLTLIISLFISLMGTTASAQTTAFANNQNHLINDPFLVVNYQGATSNIINQFSNGVIAKMQSADKDQAELFQKLFLENNVTAVMGQPQATYEDTIAYFIIDTSETSLTDAVSTLKTIEALETTEYQGYTIYSSYKRADFAATYTEGVILVSDSVTRLKLAIDNITASSNVKTLYSKIPNDSFVSVIFAPKVSAADNIELAKISDAYEHQVLSISESSTDHFTITSYNKGKTATFDSNNFSYEDYVFTPTLYKSVPGENTLFYAEMNDIYDNLTKSAELSGATATLGSDYDQLISLIAPYKDLLNGNTAFAIQFATDSPVPYLTLASQIDSQNANETTAANLLTDLLTTHIDTQLEIDELVPADLTTRTGTLTGKDISSAINDAKPLKLTYGIKDNAYLISNNPNIATEFNGANTLTNNATFTNAITTNVPNGLTTAVTGLSYVNPATLSNLITYAVTSFDPNLDSTNQADITEVTTYLESLQPWVIYSVANSKYETTDTAKLQLPLNSLLTTLLATAGDQLISTEIKPTYEQKLQFNDVDLDNYENIWYSNDLLELANDNIIQGSQDGFSPANSITRAEYITMLVRHYNLKGDCLGSTKFSDVEAGAWYDANICTAYEHGLIKGDDNGNTVRPNAPINRAEATQILANFSGALVNADTNNTFTDVKSSDWYYNAVGKAFNQEIVKGRDNEHFAPSENLNRAEAAALVNRVKHKEVHLFGRLNGLL
ncbi:hypothetical protein COV81_04385 [Candidatus Peregrinibacteria bacterium CG11_big_fil_rev_8_21_14_0_20_41_10]|nr:MAG: hypothetical protein COV81_04385 [Candidatus Peregrinibacteria bacterium CG11_big_fil_rev_8_21_14_0_20_41_10]PIZ73292.1 MAG: hypothetical protein COY06_05615 [Candidatus Peregrinibacteria bacterium CG_4_10_14_0_2_um_filter_41_8]PJC38016.1 MAG: hypothetical protein CO045_02515 [Candidatus Peregrinibacteria bacterium CG_4_9_14_0_2_um_filter_41_14]